MNKFLIFTGIGDISYECFSWLNEKSSVYDRACFYYGDDEGTENLLKSKNSEYYFKRKGMIWENFAKLYDKFSHYDYVLIVDSDLHLDKDKIEETFIRSSKNNWTAVQWSRDPNSFGAFMEHFATKGSGVRESNFIEMGFMMLRKDVLQSLVSKWNELDLTYSTGIGMILSNIAIHEGYLPFHIIDDYAFYNPSIEDKGRREIDFVLNNKVIDRLRELRKVMRKDEDYWQFNLRKIVVK